jgi:mannose-6-phosphate isomerase-like protein (cupin superfamily)
MPADTARTHVHKSIDTMETIWRGSYVRARGELAVTAFGLGVTNLPAGFDRMPPHVHTFDGQEEVYIPLSGAGEIELGERRVAIDPETAVRVGPSASRRLVTAAQPLHVLIVGGTPGQAYQPFAPLELGAPEPEPAELPGLRAMATVDETQLSDDDFDVLNLAQMERVYRNLEGVTFRAVGRELGVSAFGIAVLDLDHRDGESAYPLHDHADDGQTEVYVVQRGSGTLVVGDERVEAVTGDMISVGPEPQRQWFAGPDGLRLISIGAPSGKPYERRQS